MDPLKKDTLIQWLNKLNPDHVIESIHDLSEGEQFAALLSKIKGSVDNASTRKERFESIRRFIEDHYDHNIVEQVNFDKGNELDFSKIAVLMLAVGVEGQHNEEFMKAALSLSEWSQLEIMNLLQKLLIVSPDLKLDTLFVTKSGDVSDYDDPTLEEVNQPETSPSRMPSDKPVAFGSLTDILSPFRKINVNHSSPSSTPLHTFISSSGLNSREEIEQKNILLRKLSKDLNLERHLRSEMELDLEEKSKTISLKDNKIRELDTQIRDLKKLQDELDECSSLKEQYDKLVLEADKVQNQREELKLLKAENTSLRNENSEVYEELNKLKEMKNHFKMAQLDLANYLEKLQQEERKCSNLQQNLDHQQKQLEETINSKNFIEDNLAKLREMYNVLKRDHEESVAFQSDKQPAGESMNVITELLMDELKKELEDIKSTWITPAIHEQLKIDLTKVSSERDILESKLHELQEESLSLQSKGDLLKNEMEKMQIERDSAQHDVLDKQHTIDKLKESIESFSTKECNWQQTELKYKSDLQQNQARLAQVELELSTTSTELRLTNMQLESDTKCNENRRQTLVMSMDTLKSEKKSMEQRFQSEKAEMEEEIKTIRIQLESAEEEFSSKQQELVLVNENNLVEIRELERQLGAEKRLHENAEKLLVCQREEAAKELSDNVDSLMADIKEYEKKINNLESKLREKTKEFDSQIESHKTTKFDLERRITKLETYVSTSNQEKTTLQTELKNLEETILGQKQMIAKLNDKLSKGNNEKTQLNKKIQDVEKSLVEAVNKSQHWMNKHNSEKLDFETKLNSLTQENTELLETSKDVQEKLSEQLRSSLEDNSQLNSKLQGLNDQIENLKERCEENESVQDQLSQLQDLYQSLQEQNDNLNNVCTKSQSQLILKETECADLGKKLSNVIAEKEIMEEKHINELGSTRQALSQEIINLNQQVEEKQGLLNESISSLQDFAAKILHSMTANNLIEDSKIPTNLSEMVSFLHQKVYQCIEETSNERKCLQNQVISQSVHLEEVKQNLENQLKVSTESFATLKNEFENIACENQEIQERFVKQSKELEKSVSDNRSLEDSKAALEDQLSDKERDFKVQLDVITTEHKDLVVQLGENKALNKDLTEQIEILNEEKQGVIVQLEENKALNKDLTEQIEILNTEKQALNKDLTEQIEINQIQNKELIEKTELLNTEKQDVIAQLGENKALNKDLTEQIEIHKALNKDLTEQIEILNGEKQALNNELTEQIEILNEEKQTLNKDLTEQIEMLNREKQGVMAQLGENKALNKDLTEQIEILNVEKQALNKDLTEQIEILNVEKQALNKDLTEQIEILNVEKQALNKDLTEQIEILNVEKQALNKDLTEQIEILNVEKQALNKDLTEQIEILNEEKQKAVEKLELEIVNFNECTVQNRKHVQEVIQMKEKFEEYEVKIKSLDEEHQGTLQKVIIEFQENISTNYVPKEEFDSKLTDEAIKYSQLEERFKEKEEKLQTMFKEYEDKISEVTQNYENKIATDFVPHMTLKSERENLTAELDVQKTLYQKKLEALNEEHKTLMDQRIVEFKEDITNKYVMKSDFESVEARLNLKEKEFSKQRAEYELVVAASDKVNEQYESSMKSCEKKITDAQNKIESQNSQIECLQEQIADMTVNAEREYNELKREMTQCLNEKDEGVKAFKEEMTKIHSAYEEEVTKSRSMEEQIKVLEETHSQELKSSQTKFEELHQTQCATLSNYKKIIQEKEEELSVLKDQLVSGKQTIAEQEKQLAANKENQGEEIKRLSGILEEVKAEYHQLKKKNSSTEVYFHSREQKLLADHNANLAKAEELNSSLASRLQISQKELQIFKKKHEHVSTEFEGVKELLKAMKQEKQSAVSKLQEFNMQQLQKQEEFVEEKLKLKMEIAKLTEKYSEARLDYENLEKLVTCYKSHEVKLLAKLETKDSEYRKNHERLLKKVKMLEEEKQSLTEMFKKEQNKSQQTDKECKGLKSRIVDLNDQLEKAQMALFNNSSQSPTFANDSLEGPASSSKLPYNLRMLGNRRKTNDCNLSPISVYNSPSLKSSTSSSSTSSRTPVPSGVGKMFKCEDEPNMFDWGRLTEIKRRNTMVPAHLRSTYPAELQNIPSPLNTNITQLKSSGKRKRKSPASAQKKHVKHSVGPINNSHQVRNKVRDENTPLRHRYSRVKTPVGQKFTGRPSVSFDINNTPKLARRRQKGRSTILHEQPQPERRPLRTRNFTQTSL
ncbi:COP1-interactive protein 1-like isoform X2 [Argonauta hians]